MCCCGCENMFETLVLNIVIVLYGLILEVVRLILSWINCLRKYSTFILCFDILWSMESKQTVAFMDLTLQKSTSWKYFETFKTSNEVSWSRLFYKTSSRPLLTHLVTHGFQSIEDLAGEIIHISFNVIMSNKRSRSNINRSRSMKQELDPWYLPGRNTELCPLVLLTDKLWLFLNALRDHAYLGDKEQGNHD